MSTTKLPSVQMSSTKLPSVKMLTKWLKMSYFSWPFLTPPAEYRCPPQGLGDSQHEVCRLVRLGQVRSGTSTPQVKKLCLHVCVDIFKVGNLEVDKRALHRLSPLLDFLTQLLASTLSRKILCAFDHRNLNSTSLKVKHYQHKLNFSAQIFHCHSFGALIPRHFFAIFFYFPWFDSASIF
jgi:hypothetical protein